MAKEKKKKQVLIDYGKLNRSMFQNMRAVGILVVVFSAVAIFSNGIQGHLSYIPILLAGIACAAYGIYGLRLVHQAEEIEKQKKLNGNNNRK